MDIFQVYLFRATIVYPFQRAASDTFSRTWRTPRWHARPRFVARAADSPPRPRSTAVAIVSPNCTRFEERKLNELKSSIKRDLRRRWPIKCGRRSKSLKSLMINQLVSQAESFDSQTLSESAYFVRQSR